MNPIEHSVADDLIRAHYGDRTAKRSGVPLIAHIEEGLEILVRLEADRETMEAYAVHPLFQADDDLAANRDKAVLLPSRVVMLAMEYRSVANAFLSDQVEKGPDERGREAIYPRRPLRLSPLAEVNRMLVADKVQNRKDFEIHHKGTHARSDELDFYFRHWLKALGLDEGDYQTLIRGLKAG